MVVVARVTRIFSRLSGNRRGRSRANDTNEIDDICPQKIKEKYVVALSVHLADLRGILGHVCM